MSELYELHVYTAGSRTYANAVCKGIDPDGKYFGDRILSRDESGSELAFRVWRRKRKPVLNLLLNVNRRGSEDFDEVVPD